MQISYYTHRILIGVLGMLLPPLLLLSSLHHGGIGDMQLSISHYYYTGRGDFLVVVISILCVFLLTYRGPEIADGRRKGKAPLADTIIATLAGLFGLGIAFFPTANKEPLSRYNIHVESTWIPKVPYVGELHLLCAALFFILISIMCLWLFTRKAKEKVLVTPQKRKRNVVYYVCGVIMLACLVILLLYFWIPSFRSYFGKCRIVFWLEAIALEAFGIAWITKGEAIFPDVPGRKPLMVKNLVVTIIACMLVYSLFFLRDRAESQRISKELLSGTWICGGEETGSFYFRTDSMTYWMRPCGSSGLAWGEWDVREVVFNGAVLNFLLLTNKPAFDTEGYRSPYMAFRVDTVAASTLRLTEVSTGRSHARTFSLVRKE